jgi:NADH-quinone oxidoreductase subunit A
MPDSTSFVAGSSALAAYVVGVLLIAVIMLCVPFVLGGRDRRRAKGDPFECGVVPVGTARLRQSAKFYLVAMFFVIFDLESVFLYAWAVAVRASGWPGFIEAAVFITVLLAGLFYIWRLGGLEWAPTRARVESYRWLRHQRPAGPAGTTAQQDRPDAPSEVPT